MGAIKHCLLGVFLLLMLTGCSAQNVKETFVKHEKQYESGAKLLLSERARMLEISACGVNKEQVISFTSASLGKCFSDLDESVVKELESVFEGELASLIYVGSENVRFQVAQKSNNLTTEFYYIIYSPSDKSPVVEDQRDHIEKVKLNWYLLTVEQDTF